MGTELGMQAGPGHPARVLDGGASSEAWRTRGVSPSSTRRAGFDREGHELNHSTRTQQGDTCPSVLRCLPSVQGNS